MSCLSLTELSDDQKAFKEALREFAQSEIKPLVTSMDDKAQMEESLIRKLFEMGLMGIEAPEEFGGGASSFTMACMAVEELAKVDGSVSVLVDVQNTLVTNAFLKWASLEQKKKYLPKLSQEWGGGLRFK